MKQRVEHFPPSSGTERSQISPVLEEKIFLFDVCIKCGKRIYRS
jgi:hypothetical protein